MSGGSRPREGAVGVAWGNDRVLGGTSHLLLMVTGLIALACAAPEAWHEKERAGGDPRNTTYRIEGRDVQLRSGVAETPAAPGSAAKVKTEIIGAPAHGDLDGDRVDDAALFLAHETGGSGTFYYVAAALRAGDLYRGTNAIFLGDRVKPGTLEIRDRVLVVEYTDRLPGESFSVAPSEEVTVHLALRGGELVVAGGEQRSPSRASPTNP